MFSIYAATMTAQLTSVSYASRQINYALDLTVDSSTANTFLYLNISVRGRDNVWWSRRVVRASLSLSLSLSVILVYVSLSLSLYIYIYMYMCLCSFLQSSVSYLHLCPTHSVWRGT